MLFADLVATSEQVSSTRKRREKTSHLADLLSRIEHDEIPIALGFLAGEPRQGRIGVGWRTVTAVDPDTATDPTLAIGDVDAAITAVMRATGPGSQAARREIIHDLFARATAAEVDFLRRLFTGGLRQGANESLVADGVAKAAGVAAKHVRRAIMLSGDLSRAGAVALTRGEDGLHAIGLRVGRAVQPMLASTAESVTDAVADLGEVSVEWKLDGVRVQVHRDGAEVRVFTRNLNDVTDRTPEIVSMARGFAVDRFVLDGEALVFDGERPEVFQSIMSRFGRDDPSGMRGLQAFFFDVLHAGGRDLIDEPLRVRAEALAEVVGPAAVIPTVTTSDAAAGEAFLTASLEAGHEGVMVKGVDSLYEAGRRGKAWRKVKPVRTFDLVVLAAEWGHGRREGWLSNLHLGARADDGDGFVMVGKTFKGMTDEILAWQTEQFLAREVRRDGIVVHIRPELVVEIAVDGAQASTRYAGGVALRFARLRAYRPDKTPHDADPITAVRALLA